MKKNMAYDFSLFEQSEDENNKVKGKNKGDSSRATEEQIMKSSRKKHNPFIIALFLLLSMAVLFVITIMITNQIKIAELTDNIAVQEKLLNEEKSVAAQLAMKMESRLSLDTVERYASENLHMRKVQPYQLEYVNIASKDKLEVYNNEKDTLLDTIRKAFS